MVFKIIFCYFYYTSNVSILFTTIGKARGTLDVSIMNRHLKLTIFLCTLITLQGCSYSYDIYIVNRSGNPVTIEYTFVSLEYIPSVFNTDLQIAPFNSDDPNSKITSFDKCDYSFDSTKLTMTCELSNDKVLNVGWVGGGVDMENSEEKKAFFKHIKVLKVFSKSDTLICKTNFISGLFSRAGDEYVYKYTID